MGLEEALAQVGAKVGDGSEYYRMDGTVVGPILTTDSNGWNGVYGMHRADLSRVLAEALPGTTVRTAHRCVGFEQNADVAQLKFANGMTPRPTSLLAQTASSPSCKNTSSNRPYQNIPAPVLIGVWLQAPSSQNGGKKRTKPWMGDGKHFMVYPVRRGELLNYVGFVPTTDETIESWSAIGDRDELAASFEGWDPRVVGLLEKVDTCFWWGLYDRKPLASWTNARLALLGDAAHAMLPHLGQGANQAIEDGVALAVFLEGQTPGEIVDALRRYEAFRHERTDIVQAEARKNGLRFDSRYKSLKERDKEIASSAEFRKWLYDYDVEKAAISYLSKV